MEYPLRLFFSRNVLLPISQEYFILKKYIINISAVDKGDKIYVR